jgi:hypothetical protein
VHLRQAETEADARSAWLGNAYLTWARALRADGKTDEANAAYASALKELTPTMGADNPKTRDAAEGLAATASPKDAGGPRPANSPAPN